MPAPLDLTGQVFGRLTAIALDTSRTGREGRYRRRYWICQCECGASASVQSTMLTSGHTGSCGCLVSAYTDLTGQRFGDWTVLARSSKRGRHIRWLCRCVCGTERAVFGFSLTSGKATRCTAKQDLTGRTFGKWTVLGRGKKKRRIQYWRCRCECGTQRDVVCSSLNTGISASCGCTIGIGNKRRFTRHGRANDRMYWVWVSMRQRCNNPNNKGYGRYGGRGIRVSPDWDTFEGFERDMGPTYVPGLTLDRIDVNGNYCLGNCMWVPLSAQAGNRRPSSEWKRRAPLSSDRRCLSV